MVIRRDRFDVRLLELKEPFYNYIEANNLNRSDVMRHFIQQGLNSGVGFSYEQQQELKQEIVELKRLHSAIGTNLNQIARYFNQNGYLIESDLNQNHQKLLSNQKEITRLLNDLIGKL